MNTTSLNTPNLGAEIKARRKAAGLSQKELADRSGFSSAYLCKVEKGEANLTLSALKAFIEGIGCGLSIRITSGVEDIPEEPPLNLASRIQSSLDVASPELLNSLSVVIEIVAKAYKNEAGQYWRSISSELLSLAYKRRTGA